MKIESLTPYWPWLLGLLIGAALGAALGYFGQCTSGTCPLTSTWWRGAIYGGVIGLLFALSNSSQPRRPEIEAPRETLPSDRHDAGADKL